MGGERARGAIEAARNDIEAGRLWKARDRLDGAVRTSPHDVELLLLLGQVLYEMRDLPRAGAVWMLTERDDEAARSAIAALYERCGRDETLLRRAIPYSPPIEEYGDTVHERLVALGVRPTERPARARVEPRSRLADRAGPAAVAAIGMLVLAAVAAIWIVGLADVFGAAFGTRGRGAEQPRAIATALVGVVAVGLLFGMPVAAVASIRGKRAPIARSRWRATSRRHRSRCASGGRRRRRASARDGPSPRCSCRPSARSPCGAQPSRFERFGRPEAARRVFGSRWRAASWASSVSSNAWRSSCCSSGDRCSRSTNGHVSARPSSRPPSTIRAGAPWLRLRPGRACHRSRWFDARNRERIERHCSIADICHEGGR